MILSREEKANIILSKYGSDIIHALMRLGRLEELRACVRSLLADPSNPLAVEELRRVYIDLDWPAEEDNAG